MKRLFLLLAAFAVSATLFAQEKMKEKTKMHQDGKMKGKMQDCVMMEDGKMMMMKDGQSSAMDADMTMKNGTTVMTDGTVKMKSGKTMKLKDGQCVYMNGTVASMKMHKGKEKMKEKM